MQAHFFKKFSLAKIVFYPIKKIYPLLLPSHNCIIIFIQCSVFKVHLVEIKSAISYFTQALNTCLRLCFSSSIQTRFAALWMEPEFSKKLNEASSLEATSVNLLKEVVGQNGLEPSTSRLSVVCSSQLSYWPIRLLFLVEISGIEPLTSCLQGRRSPSWAKPPDFSSPFKLHLSMYPLNWITHRVTNTSCTDLRTLQVKSSFHLKSP